MEYEFAYRKLFNHANLSDGLPKDESIVFSLWQSVRKEHLPELESLRDDIINCFEIVNKTINGKQPSAGINESSVLDRNLALAVTSIIESCSEYSLIWDRRSLYTEEARTMLRETTWILLCSWNAILHGDIDSLIEHVRLAYVTKELS